MYKNHYIYKRLIFLVLMVVLSCANIGFSSFQYIADNDSANVADDFTQETSNNKTLSLIPMAINGLAYEYTYLNPTTGQVTDSKQELTIDSASDYSDFKTAIQANTNDSSFLEQFLTFDSEEGTLLKPVNKTINSGIYTTQSKTENLDFVIEVIDNLTFKSQGIIGNKYGGKVSIYLQESFIEYVAPENLTTIDINFTNEITTSQATNIVLQELAQYDPTITYSVLGFYNSFNNGVLENKYINDTFTDTITIYLALYKPIPEQIGKYSVTETINNIQSGTYDFYVNNPAGGGQNIWNDYSYDQTTSSFNLGFSNLVTTINEGSVINFALNDGFVQNFNEIPSTDPPTSVNPDTQSNAKQYTIKLINDLHIYGTLNLHARIGNSKSESIQSSINGGYANLDLNGHNIYVHSNGVLNSYGIVEDSVGSGQIYVESGGQLSSLVTIQDYKGGTTTTQLTKEGVKVFPFTNYFFPYLRCKVFVECVKNSQNVISTGVFSGIVYLKLINDVSGYSIPLIRLTLPFIGTTENTFFKVNDITINNAEKSGVFLNFNFNENVNFNSFDINDNEYKFLTTIRNKWDFINLDISLNKITMDVMGTLTDALSGFAGFVLDIILGMAGNSLPQYINTDEYVFPIPSYFDLNFTNSKFHFSQPVQILPGASLYFDENSFVFLEYNSSRSAGLYSSGDAVNIFKNGDFINQRQTSTSTDDLSSAGLFNTKSIWQYSNQPSIYCLGTIVFTKGNSISPYILTGAVNFNRVAICDSNGANLQELNVDKSQLFSALQNNNVNVKTYSYFIYPGNEKMTLKSYTLPLISYDSAYVYNSDGTNNLTGTYNQDTGIFTDNTGSNYFFLNDQTFNLTNTSTTLAPLENFDSNQNYITYKGANYIYFGGCYWLATSISENIATININKANSDSPTAEVTYDTARNLWLK